MEAYTKSIFAQVDRKLEHKCKCCFKRLSVGDKVYRAWVTRTQEWFIHESCAMVQAFEDSTYLDLLEWHGMDHLASLRNPEAVQWINSHPFSDVTPLGMQNKGAK